MEQGTRKKTPILNVEVLSLPFDEFVAGLNSGVVFTPNIDHFVRLQRDHDFYEAYAAAEHIVCDSRVVQLLSRLFFPRNGIVAQIAGSDLLPAYCRHAAREPEGARVFLLGGTQVSVEAARNNLDRLAGTPVIVGTYSPPFGFESDPYECERIIQSINESGATALAVGVGSPKQELWIHRHRAEMPGVDVFIGVGATIEFAAEARRRAPRWMTHIGLEWLYRLIQEPRRLARRYLVNDPRFFWFFLKQRLGIYRNPWT